MENAIVLMKKVILKYLPIFIAIIGFILSVCIFLVHKYSFGKNELIFWIPLTAFNTLTALLLGLLIKWLHERSFTDILTGLYNRRYFYRLLKHEIEKVKRSKSDLSLAIIDVDNFKKINDTHGHIEGDRVLRKISAILKEQTRTVDIVARWGGEEFVIILPDTDSVGARIFSERVRRVVEGSRLANNATISIGIATYKNRIGLDDFINMADSALYKAKEKKNTVFYTESSVVNFDN